MWVFPKIVVSQNGWFIVVPNPIKMDDLGGPALFLEGHPCGSYLLEWRVHPKIRLNTYPLLN